MASAINTIQSELNDQSINHIHMASKAGEKAGEASAVQERFLKLFIAQLQAQDPLNPLDNAQMTTQMAQINQVSGMEKLNRTMQGLLDAQHTSRSLAATSMIGRQALVEGNELAWKADGKKVTGALRLDSDADKVTVQVKNAQGAVVDFFTLNHVDAGVTHFEWDGTDAQNRTLGAGDYRFDITVSSSGANDNTPVAATTYTNHQVSAIVWENPTQPKLVLSNGRRVDLSEIIQIS